MEDAARIDVLREQYLAMRAEVGKVIVGQEEVVEEMMIALVCAAYVLPDGWPRPS